MKTLRSRFLLILLACSGLLTLAIVGYLAVADVPVAQTTVTRTIDNERFFGGGSGDNAP